MIVLLLGSGGREHALARTIAASPHCERLYVAPGNPGTAACGDNVALDPLDAPALMAFCAERGVDLVVVGPEAPLVAGVADAFAGNPAAPPVVGPSRAGAQLEGSKAFAKAFMDRHGIPTAAYRSFTAAEKAEGTAYLAQAPLPIVLKADGLAAGKGVVICTDRAEAQAEFAAMLDGKFGEAGARVVIEQFLEGTEMSVFALTDGEDYVLLPTSKDYKRAGEGDTGPNTGGMGAVAPVPFADAALMDRVRARVVAPTVAGLSAEDLDYVGFVYFGLMIDPAGEPWVIEYNCRMGDPETQAVLPLLDEDLWPVRAALPDGRLAVVAPGGGALRAKRQSAATVILAAEGYPGPYPKGRAITGDAAPAGPDNDGGELVFHAGTGRDAEGVLRSTGGRVLAVTGLGDTLEAALERAYRRADRIAFGGLQRRGDIGRDVLDH